ncbi:Uncharacterised protein [Mycobacteroides abscessus subsp. abscessus]|nr:Uncharacterised protein [Mycobacteroides abscessus subsp. abscessus]
MAGVRKYEGQQQREDQDRHHHGAGSGIDFAGDLLLGGVDVLVKLRELVEFGVFFSRLGVTHSPHPATSIRSVFGTPIAGIPKPIPGVLGFVPASCASPARVRR